MIARMSRIRPLLRSGPRITARGRQISANAAPIRRPVHRVIVDRYSVSAFEIERSPTCQNAPATSSPLAASSRPGWNSSADRHRDRDRGEDQPAAESRQAPGTAPPDQHRHDDRPEQVELLLDRQAPHVPQRRERAGRGVPLTDPDLVPVRHVADPAEDVTAQLAELLAFEDPRVRDHQQEHEEQRRKQSPSAASPEATKADVPGPFVLTDEQQRDQVAADHEENLDPEEAARQPDVVGVVHHHGDDGERPHAVEARQVGQARQRPATGSTAEAPARAAACRRVRVRRATKSRGHRYNTPPSYTTPRPRFA